jgi:hypothetical protein
MTRRLMRMLEMLSASRRNVELTYWEGLAQSGCVEERRGTVVE